MSAPCPGCGQPISDDDSAYGNVCRHCGYILKTSAASTASTSAGAEPLQPHRPLLQQKHRGLLWLVFWFLFLGAPLTPFLNEATSNTLHIRFRLLSEGVTVVGSIVGGTLGAGFILGRLYSRTATQLVIRGILFSLGIFVFYVIAAYAGCMIMLSGFN